jgi:hypothetical protein
LDPWKRISRSNEAGSTLLSVGLPVVQLVKILQLMNLIRTPTKSNFLCFLNFDTMFFAHLKIVGSVRSGEKQEMTNLIALEVNEGEKRFLQ